MTRLFAGTPFDIPPRCEDCGEIESACRCSPEQKKASAELRARLAQRLPPSMQSARIRIEKRKGGRVATVVSGLTGVANDLPDLLRQLQACCGTGGTVKSKEDLIELQGDHVTAVRAELAALGYRIQK